MAPATAQRLALERAVDVSRSNRAADSAFFALFGTHHLLAAFVSGAVPIVFAARPRHERAAEPLGAARERF
jgi:hypothetical protein